MKVALALIVALAIGWGLGVITSQRINTAAAMAYHRELFVVASAAAQRAHEQTLAAQARGYAFAAQAVIAERDRLRAQQFTPWQRQVWMVAPAVGAEAQ